MNSINLMSYQARRHGCLHARLRQWTHLLLVLLGILSIVASERYMALRRAVQQQLVLEATYDPIQELKTANKLLAKQITAIRREEQFVLALSEREPTITLLGLLGKAIAGSKDRLFLQKIELNTPGQADGAPAERSTLLDLAGVASNGSAVNELAETLRGAMSFAKVEVISTNDYQIKKQPMQDFSLQCNY